MRIVVNDIAANTGGALTILKDFYNYIKENDRENEWYFLLSDRYIEENERIHVVLLPEVKKSWFSKLRFDFVSGRRVINALKPDRVLSLQNTITFGVKAPQWVYIHQAIPFQDAKKFSFFDARERKMAVYQHLIGKVIKLSAKKADKVVVQTEWMKKAVAEKTGIGMDKIISVLPAVEDLSEYRNAKLFSERRFFYPTAKSIYKNNACIYKACELLRQRGISDFSVKLTIEAPRGVESENLIFTGRLPREEVLREYSSATLIFPSYIETFGYPLVEAHQIGTIILAADCPFAREVLCGYENAYFFDPFKPEDLAEWMEKVMGNSLKKKDLKVQKSLGGNGWYDLLRDILKN